MVEMQNVNDEDLHGFTMKNDGAIGHWTLHTVLYLYLYIYMYIYIYIYTASRDGRSLKD